MSRFTAAIQHRFKTSSAGLVTLLLKVFSGLVLGLTLSLIGETVFEYSVVSFVLVMVVTLMSFLRIAKSWNWVSVLIFDLFMVLLGLLLRMYILVAPGA